MNEDEPIKGLLLNDTTSDGDETGGIFC